MKFSLSQIDKFYLTSFLKNQVYFTPILVLFLQDNLLNFSQIFWIFTFGSVFSFLIELPTGVFADLFGKKRSIILSKFLIFIAYLSFGFSSSFFFFVLSQIILEFGNSLKSGTETAYIFDYIQQYSPGLSYTEVKGKQKFWARLSEAFGTLVGGYLAVVFGYRWVFFLASIPALLNFIISLTWDDILESRSSISFKVFKQHIFISFKDIFSNNFVVRVLFGIVFFTSVFVALGKFIQPFLLDIGVSVEYFGVVYAVILGITSFSVRYSYIFERYFSKVFLINSISFLATLFLFLFFLLGSSYFGLIILFLLFILENIRSPIANHLFYLKLKSETRATTGSILSLFKSLGKVLVLPFVGYFADLFSIYIAVLVLVLVLFFSSVFFFVTDNSVV